MIHAVPCRQRTWSVTRIGRLPRAFDEALRAGQPMRVTDVERSIYDGLRALPWLQYLSTMCVLCEMLRNQYRDRLGETEQPLMTETIRIAEETAESGRPDDHHEIAATLRQQWAALIDDDWNVTPGHWNTWCTYDAIAGEIVGNAKHYSGTERLLLAITDPWREPYPGKARRINPDELADDASPMAQALAAFNRVVIEARHA
jgi:hypothetical protein